MRRILSSPKERCLQQSPGGNLVSVLRRVPSEERLWEKHVFWVAARDPNEAQAKAEQLAKSEECSYTAVTGSNVPPFFLNETMFVNPAESTHLAYKGQSTLVLGRSSKWIDPS